jgi:hypothetical protein
VKDLDFLWQALQQVRFSALVPLPCPFIRYCSAVMVSLSKPLETIARNLVNMN